MKGLDLLKALGIFLLCAWWVDVTFALVLGVACLAVTALSPAGRALHHFFFGQQPGR